MKARRVSATAYGRRHTAEVARPARTILELRRTISIATFDELSRLVERVGAMLYRLIHPKR